MCKVLVDALRRQRGLQNRVIGKPGFRSPAFVESDSLLLLLPQLVEPARGAHADFARVSFKALVLSLLRIDGHRHRFVADVLGLVGSARLGDGAATALIEAGRKIAGEGVKFNLPAGRFRDMSHGAPRKKARRLLLAV